MARTNNNPLTKAQAPYQFKDIVLFVVTHLPNFEGYHSDRYNVVMTCLETIRYRNHRDHTFMVWDNGSCNEFRDVIQNQFKPDVFIQSPNIGKNTARFYGINMLPTSSIVAYSDDDMYYHDNWLNPQIELLSNFPNVSVVSGYTVRTMFRWGCENTIAWAEKNATLKRGRFISREDEDDYCISIGRDPAEHTRNTVKDIDYKIQYEGMEAYATAHHAQFIGYAAKLRNYLHYDNNAMTDERPTDIVLDKVGLRLSTTKRYVQHIGNTLDDRFKEVKKEVEQVPV